MKQIIESFCKKIYFLQFKIFLSKSLYFVLVLQFDGAGPTVTIKLIFHKRFIKIMS